MRKTSLRLTPVNATMVSIGMNGAIRTIAQHRSSEMGGGVMMRVSHMISVVKDIIQHDTYPHLHLFSSCRIVAVVPQRNFIPSHPSPSTYMYTGILRGIFMHRACRYPRLDLVMCRIS